MIVHAGLVTLHDRGRWRGALVEGPSGAGKSDLALRALALGFRLVADDRTELWTSEGTLWGACPPPLAGLIEARGLGVIAAPALRPWSQIALVVECLPPGQDVERMPQAGQGRELLGVWLPLLRIQALDASAPLKLHASLSRLGARP